MNRTRLHATAASTLFAMLFASATLAIQPDAPFIDQAKKNRVHWSQDCSNQEEVFTDHRDGRKYRMVTIGTQTWMAENLDFETPDSWCYDHSQSNCRKYGRLYAWEAAKKACPAGWHLPSEKEWITLERHLGMSAEETKKMLMRGDGMGTKLKSKGNWEIHEKENAGYDIYGFNALPAGLRVFHNSSFSGKGKRAAWWSSSSDGKYTWRRTLILGRSGIDRDLATRTNGFSVRCIKDQCN